MRNESKVPRFHLHRDEPGNLQFDIFSLKDHLINWAKPSQKPHAHSYFQIIWFMKGGGKHYVDFNEYDINENSLFFISKGQIHHFDDNVQDGIIIHFNETFMSNDQNFTDIFLKHNIFHSFEKEPLFKFNKSDVNELHNIVKKMQIEILTPDKFAHDDYLRTLLHLFLIIVQRSGVRKNCNGLSMNKTSNVLFIKFKKLLEENYKRHHKVQDYADLLGLSTKTLTNYTKEVSQQTPLSLINDRLILEAKRLLTYSDNNINQICYELGFEDPSYFVKFFKRIVKISPSDFRIKIK